MTQEKKMPEIITVLSGKGGTGKTLMAANLGVRLAADGYKVLIIDGNFQSRGVDMALELESRVIYDMVDVLRGDCRIRQALTRHHKYPDLYILEPPVFRKGGGIRMVEFETLLERVQEGFDYVIIDTSSSSTEVCVQMGLMSRRCLLITTQDPVSLRAGQSLLAALKEKGMPSERCRLLVNNVRLKLADEGYLLDVEDIADAFGIPVCGVIPYDENMHVAFSNGCPVADLEDSEAGAHLSRVFHRFLLTE